MTEGYSEQSENKSLFRRGNNRSESLIFHTTGSKGSNPEKLAQILVPFEMVIALLGWEDKPLARLPHFLTQYQASIDGKYHRDYKDIEIAEEIEKRRQERKGTSLTIQQ